MDVGRKKDIGDGQIRDGVDQSGSGSVHTIEGDDVGAFVVGAFGSDEAADEWVEVGECEGEGMVQPAEEFDDVQAGGGFLVEMTLLDVVDGEHEEVPWRQVYWAFHFVSGRNAAAGLEVVFWWW
ncbi:unnamed protein product [Linum trigynum]|uniref:Uncharacterized protein n=1 Tax=Linum trigynum TaxID=586398 RepID=A0AAV2G5U0_9ROSI